MGPGNRPLDLVWLEDFLALAESGNFSRAAEARAIAQPAFSRHIRSLEEWVGVDLFDRSTHPAELTLAGKRFRPLIEEVMAGLEAARIKARAAHDQAAASLRFAVTHVLSLHFFPQWLSRMESHVRVGPVQTMSDSYAACEDLMLQRRVQFVLCYGHKDVEGRLDEGLYPMMHLGDDDLVPVSAPAARGAPKHPVESDGETSLLAYSEASGIGRILRSRRRELFGPVAERSGVAGVQVVFTAHNASLLKAMVLEGRGVAWLPLGLVGQDLKDGHLVEAGPARWRVPIEIRLYRQRSELAPVAEAVWAACGKG